MATSDVVGEERPATLPELVRAHARRDPGAPFLVARSVRGRDASTYGEFDELTDRVAAGLAADGLARGDRLALCLDNRDAYAFYVLLFAAYKAAIVPVPVNARLAAEEIEFVVADCGASRLVVPRDRVDELETVSRSPLWTGEEVTRLAAADGPVPAPPALDDRADILYTSGTTGTPKGACFRHRSLALFARLLAQTLRLRPDDVYQTPAPVYTSTGTHTCPLPVLYAGGAFVVEERFDVELTAQALDDERPTGYFGVPAMFTLLLERLAPDRTFPHVRSIFYGGSTMPVTTLERIPERFPNAGLWNMYGLTEGGPNGCVLPPEHALDRPESVGFPLERTDLRIVDDEGCDVPPGAPGEILLRAPTLMDGYLNRPEETALAIVDGWLRTGDVGRRDADGFVYILDRVKDMIVRGGFNVYPAEVEAVLLSHPDVLEAAVVAVPHPVLGEDVAAAVVRRAGATLDEEELRALCERRLGDFKRPRHYRMLDALPRNSMGKLLKRELREEFAAWLQASRVG